MDLESSSLILNPTSEISVQWNAIDIIPSYFPNITVGFSVDIALYVQQYTRTNDWNVDWVLGSSEEPFLKNVPITTDEITQVKLLKIDPDFCRLPLHDQTSYIDANICPIAIKVSLSKSNNIEALAKIGAWSGVVFIETSTKHSEICQEWDKVEEESGAAGDNLAEAVILCPPTVLLARNDRDYEKEELNSFYRETRYRQQYMDFFHPNIMECYRQLT